jgi:hypothetical protein
MINRPKISSLTEMELAQLLASLFFLVGKDVNLQKNETKLFLDSIYKYQGWMYEDTFKDAFSRYAACELPDAENLQPQVSHRFISKLMKIYLKKCNENKFIKNSVKDMPTVLTPEEKYALFVKFVSANKCLPGNADWVTLYEHITGLKKLAMPADWDALPFFKKWRYAMQAVTDWAYSNYKITQILLYKNPCGHITHAL